MLVDNWIDFSLIFYLKKKAFNNQGIEKSPSLPPSPDEIPREPPESPFPKALKNCMKGKAEIRLCFNVRNVGVLKQWYKYHDVCFEKWL